jgi:uncharacterized membrane protein YfcA
MEFLLLIGVLSLITGFLSGMLGIGGGIIMAPLLLYVPPYFGFPALAMQTVTGLTIVQGLTACVFGALAHGKLKAVSLPLSGWMGSVIFAAALAGGSISAYVGHRHLLLIFALLALAAAVLILRPWRATGVGQDVKQFTFSRPRAVAASGGVGFFGGMVGQGGSFILIPLMTSWVKVPTRIAIGSNLAIVLLSTLAAFLGKALTGQIEWLLALPVVLAVIPAVWLGAHVSHRVPVGVLRQILAVCITLAALRIGWTALGGW